jgi:SAM-dependent methyltransferase
MNQGGGIPRTFDGIHAMTPDLRSLTSAKKLRRLRRWFKRNVLRQAWMLEGFGSAFAHEEMLLDQIRCDAYREAIRCTVKPGDVVVDLGAGTGLLSFFALQAGARHVYAIEMTRIADVAAELIEANGFRDRITLIRQTSTRARLPERCDVLVTETLSAFCFDTENIIEFVADARERFLKPGGRIVPESADTFLLPVSSESFGIGQLQSRLYDVDYRPFIKRSAAEYRSLRASGKPFVPFRVIADGRLDGFLGWFEARLCEGVTLSNSPYLPLTSWWQLYLPVAEQPHYRAGQTMLLCMDPNIVDGEAEWKYAVQPATPTGSTQFGHRDAPR